MLAGTQCLPIGVCQRLGKANENTELGKDR